MVRIRVVYVYLFGTERLVTTLPSLCRISLRYINIQVWACLPCVCHACMRACAVYSASCGFYLEKKNSPLGPNIAPVQFWIWWTWVRAPTSATV